MSSLLKLFLFAILGFVEPRGLLFSPTLHEVNEWKLEINPALSLRENANACGYEACDLGKPNMVNVHLVPHSHDDVGWLETVDQYYYNYVQYILDTSDSELQMDKKKKFIYVEMAFFYRWWNELDDERKETVRNVINKGRLEFILAGWSMNDEASTHYSAIIDQHTLGFDFLKENFGECGVPKIGWQIDPFGHSREQASIFAQFGFDGLFFARLDYQDYEKRKSSKTLESMWFGSDSLDDRSSLFTGALYDMTYGPPQGFCFECNGIVPVKDRTDLDDYNADQKVKQFLDIANKQASHFTTNHIMWTMGSDFHYKNARLNFKNIDKLILNVNKMQANGSKVNAFYSTPSCYLYALNKANMTYTSKSDDFFPYAHRPHSFWTGYFTSRSTLKAYERTSNSLLQVCKQLDVLGLLVNKLSGYQNVDVLKQALGVLQHHDGVSGTSQQHVAYNYAEILSKGVGKCQDVVQKALKMLLDSTLKLRYGTVSDIKFCNLLNVSSCQFTESMNNFGVIVYNPLGQKLSTYVKLPVSHVNFRVLSPEQKPVLSQMVPLSVATKNLPDRFQSNSSHELVFQVDLPPLGYSTYFVQKTNFETFENSESVTSHPSSVGIVVENEFLRLSFDKETGLLASIENLESKIKVDASQALLYYKSKVGSNIKPDNQASGAYVFRPDGNVNKINSGKAENVVVKGTLMTEVRQTFSNWATQVIRLYKGARHFELEWTVGPLPEGTEVVSSFETSIQSNKTFYTDANGRQMMKRVVDYRPTWELQQTEPVAGNYYPVNSRILLKDVAKKIQLTILTDRSQGGASLRNGHVELMLHRRTISDDALGVAEPLKEDGVDGKPLIVRGSHYVILDTIESSTSLHRSMAQYLYMSPYYGFFNLDQSPQEFVEQFNYKWSGLKSLLPDNVHILTLEEWHNGKVLLRLEHYFEKNEDPELSKPSTVSLKDLFSTLKVKSAEEYTLGANKPIGEAKRLQWNVQGYGKTPKDMDKFVTPFDQKTMEIELKSMQIRTFLLTLE